jgi:type IV secretion system protein VirB3
MAGELGKVKRDPLFLGLTRPPMILGVTYSWLMLNMVIWMAVFINTKSFSDFFLGFGVFHIIGYLACAYEPRFVDLLKVWGATVPKCLNRSYHGNTCSYDLY